MKRVIFALLFAFGALVVTDFLCWEVQCADFKQSQRTESINSRVVQAVNELLETSDYQALSKLPKRWAEDMSQRARKMLVVELLERITSSRDLKLQNLEDVLVESKIDSGEMKWADGGILLKQDIFIEGGRCAWALERLLNCDLPPITARSIGDGEVERTVRACYLKVVEAMSMPDTTDVAKLKAEERIEWASSQHTAAHLFAELAKNSNVEVRKAVAKNLKTPLRIVLQLEKYDPDHEVRKLALKNLEHVRSILK